MMEGGFTQFTGDYLWRYHILSVVGLHTDSVRIRRRALPAIRKRDSDLEAQDLYSKFYRYKLEMFNFPNHPGKFGLYQMQGYFR